MAVLSTQARKDLPDSAFAGPGRTYPIHNASHARAALSDVVHALDVGNISEAEHDRIVRALHRRYPNIGKYPKIGGG
jgi:hypothetical protein